MLRIRPTTRRHEARGNDNSAGVLVLIDQQPLRDEAATACTQAMARLERARAGWHHFERKDKPAFARWRARELGALLSTAREVETKIGECQALIHEVEMEMRRAFQDPYSAYQRVLFRRENPAAAAAEASVPRDAGRGKRKLSDFEKEALFQEWVQRSLGTNPDKMDDEAYTTSFEAFKSHMFQAAPPEPTPNEQRPPRNTRMTGHDEDEDQEEEQAKTEDARLKELYRRLVRRLHPDLRADGNAAVGALWHEVQEAYAAGDVARMEILLALSDVEANRTATQSIAQLRALLAELERALGALEKSLREAEGEDAWDFARSGPSVALRVRVERELKLSLASRSARLDLLRRTIAEWARGPAANRTVAVRR
jgi:hypothetical protein